MGKHDVRGSCDKMSVDPSKHLGPFTQNHPPYLYEGNGQKFEVVKCEACGNTVIRWAADED